MDNPESNMVCSKNYEPYEVTPLRQTPIILSLKHFFTSFSHWKTFNTYYRTQLEFIGIIESGLILYKNLISSIQLPGYNIATPTECSNEVTLLHQKKWIKYKLRKYLKSKQLEPTFIEVFQNKKILSRLCI